MTRRKEKKIANLEVRISPAKKAAFMKACEENDTNASDAVRTFVDAYLARSRHVKLKQVARDIAMTIIRDPVKSAAGFAAPIGGVVIATLLMATPSVADTYLQPIAPPAPVYPLDMIEQGISANCNAKFDVSTSGLIDSDIAVDCTHPGFNGVVRDAIKTLKFEPKIVDGKPVRVTGVVYPLRFEITSDPEAETIDVHGPEQK